MVFRRKKMQFASTTVKSALDDEEEEGPGEEETLSDDYNFLSSRDVGSHGTSEQKTRQFAAVRSPAGADTSPAGRTRAASSTTGSVESNGRKRLDERSSSNSATSGRRLRRGKKKELGELRSRPLKIDELRTQKTILWEDADADTSIVSLPSTLFLIALGAAGHAFAWRQVADTEFSRKPLGSKFAWWAWIAAIILWILCTFLLLLKLFCARKFFICELRHPSRSCYLFAPHMTAVLLALALPPTFANENHFRFWRTLILAVSACIHILLSAFIMNKWVGDRDSPVLAVAARSGPSTMLHITGWPLLALLSLRLDLDRRTGFQISAAFLGPSILLWPAMIGGLAIAARDDHRAAAAHLLTGAPASIAALFFLELSDVYNNDSRSYSAVASGLLSIAIIFTLAFIRPALREIRATIGIAWASVFPTAVLGAALTRFASNQNGPYALKAVAFACLLLNLILIVRLLLRLLVHLFYWCLGAAVWQDPIKLHSEQTHLLRSWAGIWVYTHLPQKQHNTTQRLPAETTEDGAYTTGRPGTTHDTADGDDSGVGEGEYDYEEDEESLDPL